MDLVLVELIFIPFKLFPEQASDRLDCAWLLDHPRDQLDAVAVYQSDGPVFQQIFRVHPII